MGARLHGSLILPFEEILPVSTSDAPPEIIAASERTRGFALFGSVSDETVCVVSLRVFS